MSIRISKAFAKLLEQGAPDAKEVLTARKSVGRIRGRLGQSFLIADTRWIGSHWKGTAICGHSDVDLLLVLRRVEARHGDREVSSGRLLDRVRDDLRERFPLTQVRRDAQAVSLHFTSTNVAVDVVPALYHSFGNAPVYRIPDGEDDYLLTSPASQRQSVEEAHLQSRGRLKPLVRLVKMWSLCRKVTMPIRSLYLETFVVSARTALVPGSYADSLAATLRCLTEQRLGDLDAPNRIGNAISATATIKQRQATLAPLEEAADLAERAVYLDREGLPMESLKLWGRVFNHAISF